MIVATSCVHGDVQVSVDNTGHGIKKEDLPKEMQERETPSTRKPLKEIIMEGKFRK